MPTLFNDDFEMTCTFKTEEGKEIKVTGVDKGIVKIDFTLENTPDQMARVIVGCFDSFSNFPKVVGKVYSQDSKNWFKGIEINAFGKKMLVTEENANIFSISEFIRKASEEFWDKFKNELKNELERREKALEDICVASESEEIIFSNSQSKNMWLHWTSEQMQRGIENKYIVFAAITFAKYAQFLIGRNNISIYSAFDKAYDDILLYKEFTESTLYNAIEILKRCWRYGEMLRDWFKKRQEMETQRSTVSL